MKKVGAIKQRKEDLTEIDLQPKDNVVKLELITGGKGPPSDYWLLELGIGTIFLSRNKTDQRSFVFGEFAVYNKTEKAMLLLVNEGEVRPRPVWVDPRRFSNQMELVEVVRTEAFPQVQEQENKPEEITDDKDLRTV